MGNIVRLVPETVSGETVRALETLLEDARAGRLIGLAWVCMRPGLRFEGDIAGEVRSSLLFTRGMLLVLDDELGALIRGDR